MPTKGSFVVGSIVYRWITVRGDHQLSRPLLQCLQRNHANAASTKRWLSNTLSGCRTKIRDCGGSHTYQRKEMFHMRKLTVLMLTMAMLVFLVPAASAGGNGRSFIASLKGGNEVGPVDTNAQGVAHFKVKGGELSFKLIVANIDAVVASHIHCAPADDNGPVGVTLFSGAPTSDNGVLAQGAITAPDTDNGCGWLDVADILTALGTGNTYVNVHTTAHGGGEIRGQLK